MNGPTKKDQQNNSLLRYVKTQTRRKIGEKKKRLL